MIDILGNCQNLVGMRVLIILYFFILENPKLAQKDPNFGN